MSPLKTIIFREIKENYAESHHLTDDELNALMFHNKDSLRLSLTGFVIIRNVFTAYSFEIPDTLKTKHQMGLSKMQFPYFFTKRRLIVFSEVDASMITLCGGIVQFLETYC